MKYTIILYSYIGIICKNILYSTIIVGTTMLISILLIDFNLIFEQNIFLKNHKWSWQNIRIKIHKSDKPTKVCDRQPQFLIWL